MPRYPGIIGNYDQSLSLNADAEDTMNWYLENLPPRSKNSAALYPTEGYLAWATVTQVGGRGNGLSINGRTFVVIGSGFYELFEGGTATLRGSVTQDNYPATISSNGAAGGELFITSGGNGYCYTLATNTLTQVLTGDATMGGMLDGYFIAFDINTSTIRISDVNDGLTWDPTQYLQRSTSPDSWQAMFVVQQPAGIWLPGGETGDVLYNADSFPFPFAPIQGASYGYGISAPFAFTVLGDRVMWLAKTHNGEGVIVSARGYSPQRVSTHPIETAIARYLREGRINDCEAIGYERNGHQFSVFNFPTAKRSHCYDATSGVWHRRGKWISADNDFDVWFPRLHVYAFGKHLIAGRSSSTIAVMDDIYGTELDGTAIRRIRIAPGIFNEHRRIRITNLEIYLEVGLGTTTGQGSDPTFVYQNSDDGGHNWNNERTASAGAMGERLKRVDFWRLGVPRDRVDKIVCSDPIPWRIIDAYIDNNGVRS